MRFILTGYHVLRDKDQVQLDVIYERMEKWKTEANSCVDFGPLDVDFLLGIIEGLVS